MSDHSTLTLVDVTKYGLRPSLFLNACSTVFHGHSSVGSWQPVVQYSPIAMGLPVYLDFRDEQAQNIDMPLLWWQ